MILGILSDTHGDTDAVKRVYAALPNADAMGIPRRRAARSELAA